MTVHARRRTCRHFWSCFVALGNIVTHTTPSRRFGRRQQEPPGPPSPRFLSAIVDFHFCCNDFPFLASFIPAPLRRRAVARQRRQWRKAASPARFNRPPSPDHASLSRRARQNRRTWGNGGAGGLYAERRATGDKHDNSLNTVKAVKVSTRPAVTEQRCQLGGHLCRFTEAASPGTAAGRAASRGCMAASERQGGDRSPSDDPGHPSGPLGVNGARRWRRLVLMDGHARSKSVPRGEPLGSPSYVGPGRRRYIKVMRDHCEMSGKEGGEGGEAARRQRHTYTDGLVIPVPTQRRRSCMGHNPVVRAMLEPDSSTHDATITRREDPIIHHFPEKININVRR